MTLFHDAYLFNFQAFMNKIAGYLPNPETHSNYNRLRADAIQTYEDYPLVRMLLSDYGGWDKSAFTQIAEAPPVESDDIAFWLVILLYSEFKSGLHQMGLGNEWGLLQRRLSKLGWSENEAQLLITGRKFRDFAHTESLRDAVSPDYWNYFKPFSTSSSMGWLNLDDINLLLEKLTQNKQKLSQLDETEDIAFIKAYQSTQIMLNTAKNQNSDLCLLISG